jgi:hypothetical protein
MGQKAKAFGLGSLGCLGAFILFAAIAVVLGGSAYIDIGGFIILVVIGGLIGLLVNFIYNKGRQAGPPPDERSPDEW